MPTKEKFLEALRNHQLQQVKLQDSKKKEMLEYLTMQVSQ